MWRSETELGMRLILRPRHSALFAKNLSIGQWVLQRTGAGVPHNTVNATDPPNARPLQAVPIFLVQTQERAPDGKASLGGPLAYSSTSPAPNRPKTQRRKRLGTGASVGHGTLRYWSWYKASSVGTPNASRVDRTSLRCSDGSDCAFPAHATGSIETERTTETEFAYGFASGWFCESGVLTPRASIALHAMFCPICYAGLHGAFLLRQHKPITNRHLSQWYKQIRQPRLGPELEGLEAAPSLPGPGAGARGAGAGPAPASRPCGRAGRRAGAPGPPQKQL